MVRIFLLVALFALNAQNCLAWEGSVRYSANDYIEKYKAAAIEEMTVYGIPASITLGQGMLESDFGNSDLAKYANNHFGLKCHKEWKGETFAYHDDEWNECFRKYDHPLESYADHSFFLKSRPRYCFLFDLQLTNYKAWALGLKEAGYATLPSYAIKLIEVIEKYRLYELDRQGFIPSSVLDIKSAQMENEVNVALPSDVKHKVVKFKYGNFVVVKQGDTFSKIAREFKLGLGALLQYNQVVDDALHEGDIVFIEPKKQKNMLAHHVVCKGETAKSIASFYGIDLNFLCDRNKISYSCKPKPGTVLYLERKR